jgi:hypothetical protein
MNARLKEAIEQIKALPEDRQEEFAAMLFDLLNIERNPDLYLSPEEIAEIERRASEDGPYATDEEVRATFARLTR